MRKLTFLDTGFLIGESRRTPMHVGGLHLFTLPDGVNETDYLQELAQALRYDGALRFPFGHRLKMGTLGVYGNVHAVRDNHVDLDYHIRHSALPKPGRYRELFALISRLHSTLLDRSRPLWEMHLIEGLPDRQFAIYFKVHHCVMDGMGAMHFTASMFSENPNEKIKVSPFSVEAYDAYKKKMGKSVPTPPSSPSNKTLSGLIQDQIASGSNIAKALGKTADAWLKGNSGLSVPWLNIPRTAFNGKISGARRFVAQSWDLERIKAAGKAYDGTLNDAILAMCSGALRRYLIAQNDLPENGSLKAMTPVSVRAEGDMEASNAISFITADLATYIADPRERMHAIRRSMSAGKDQLKGMSKKEIALYTVVAQSPLLLTTLTGTGSNFPAFNTVISNVPGPKGQIYWNGAEVKGIYPASIPFEGFAVNFTAVSNNGRLDFGITACRNSAPQLQRLIDYLEDALVELEETGTQELAKKTKAAAEKTPQTIAKVDTKTQSKPKAKLKPKAKSKAKAKAPVKKKVAAKKKVTTKKLASSGSLKRKKGPPKKVAQK